MDETGCKSFIIAICPIKECKNPYERVEGTEKFKEATSRGVYIIKELSDSTCEWTWAQQYVLNITAMPNSLVDFMLGQQLGWANELQEMFKRNMKEVDREHR